MRLTNEQEMFIKEMRWRARRGAPEVIDGEPVAERVFSRPPWKKPRQRSRR